MEGTGNREKGTGKGEAQNVLDGLGSPRRELRIGGGPPRLLPRLVRIRRNSPCAPGRWRATNEHKSFVYGYLSAAGRFGVASGVGFRVCWELILS